MNERIKELKEQSMEWVPNMADPDTKIRLLNAEKFAELIVRECIAQCEKNAEHEWLGSGSKLSAFNIKQHFGVEE